MTRFFAAVLAAVTSLFSIAPEVDKEAAHSDAAMAVAYASLAKAPVLPPKSPSPPAVNNPQKQEATRNVAPAGESAAVAPESAAVPVSNVPRVAATPTMHLNDGYWQEIYPGSGWIWWTWPGCRNTRGSRMSDGVNVVEATVMGEGWFNCLPANPAATVPIAAPVRPAAPPVQPAPPVVYRYTQRYGSCSGGNCRPSGRRWRR